MKKFQISTMSSWKLDNENLTPHHNFSNTTYLFPINSAYDDIFKTRLDNHLA